MPPKFLSASARAVVASEMSASLNHSITRSAAMHPACPAGIEAEDELMLPWYRRMIVQYANNENGDLELRLFYGDKEIAFDEPELFTFGETLARQYRFVACDAVAWGEGLDWPRVRALLGELLQAGVLVHASDKYIDNVARGDGPRASPLPPSVCPVARDWDDCAEITRDLTGHAVDPGHLELIVPIFRVAHIVVDTDGRQVGEANVFPRALRLDVPTEWRTSHLPGSRYQAERPMNMTAMKAMRAHWPQMMAGLLRVRAAFLRRFPEADGAWTVGHLERLATAVLGVPSYQAMRRGGARNGGLHGALSSMFRVTDGLRMVMHQMLFIPVGEPALSPDAPMSVDEILDYAERNHTFHSDYGVCAGPRMLVREFLQVLIEGTAKTDYSTVVLDAPVQAALADIDAALDYAFLGLRAYAVVFSLWPAMTRAYEHIAALLDPAIAAPDSGLAILRARMVEYLDVVRAQTLLGNEEWRVDRERAYADMFAACGRGVGYSADALDLARRLTPPRRSAQDAERLRLQARIAVRLIGSPAAPIKKLTDIILDFLLRTQAVLRTASDVQDQINHLLGRAAPGRAFTSADIDVHNLLLGVESRRLPYLIDALNAMLGIGVAVDPDGIVFLPGPVT